MFTVIDSQNAIHIVELGLSSKGKKHRCSLPLCTGSYQRWEDTSTKDWDN